MTGDELMVALFAVGTSALVGYEIFRVARAWRHVREHPVPDSVQERARGVEDEARRVRQTLHEIKKTKDPFAEMIQRIRSHSVL